ncbi:MAG: TonB-dependent siderophore receptor [Burkholderiaceae bacterium]
MPSAGSIRGAVCILACSTWIPANGQTRQQDETPLQELPAVTVTADTEGDAGRLNPPTTVGTRLPLTQREIPQSISVISQEQIKAQNLSNVQQALQNVTGLTTPSVDASRYRLYARGYEIDMLQVDGIAMPMGFLTPPSLIMFDRVEVLRGPAGLFNGAGSAGGTVNLVRKRPTRRFAAAADVTTGSQDAVIGRTDLGGPLNQAGTLRGRFVAEVDNMDYRQRDTHRRINQFYGVIEADLGAATTAVVGISHQRLNSKSMQYGYPTYTDGSFLRVDPKVYYGPQWNRETFEQTNGFAEVEHRWQEGWSSKLSLNNAVADRYSMFGGLRNAVNPARNVTQYHTFLGLNHTRQTAVDLSTSGSFALLGRTHKAIFGANYLYEHSVASNTPGAPISVDLLDPAPVVTPVAFPSTATSAATTDTRQTAVYGNARFSLSDPTSLILGARATWWKSEVMPDPQHNANRTTEQSDSLRGRITPFAGLVHDLNDRYSAYASVADIFKPQSVRNRAGQLISPLTGRQYEVGIKASYLEGRLDASAAVFRIDQKNRAIRDPADIVNTYYLAQGRSRSQGFEVQVSGALTPRWNLSAGYAFTSTRYFDSSADTGRAAFSAYTPKHLLKLWTQYWFGGALSGLSVNAGTYVSSEIYTTTNGVTIRQPGYATVDVGAAYQLNPRIELALNISNLFDREYYKSIQTPADHNFLGDPRMAMLTMRVKY